MLKVLQHPEGAPLATIAKAMRWKAHTLRAFFSTVVRRKLGLDLRSERRDGVRLYRVIERQPFATDEEGRIGG